MTSKQIGVLAAFAAANVEFAVVGGIAVNLHGYVRATNDLDLFIRPTEENAQRAFVALQAAGITLDGWEPNDLLVEYDTVRFGSHEDHVDVLPSIGQMTFDQVWRNRVDTEVAGVMVAVISKEDLIANKRQVGRSRDLADAEELELVDGQGLGDE